MAIPSPELAALFEPVLTWLDAGGDDDNDANIGFNYSWFHIESSLPSCGTTCCIAGAVGVFNPSMNFDGWSNPKFWDGAEWRANYANDALVRNYGMNKDDADALFFGGLDRKQAITPAMAAEVTRHWIQTGVVDWDRVIEKDSGLMTR